MTVVVFIFMMIGIITVIRFFTSNQQNQSMNINVHTRSMEVKYHTLFEMFKNVDPYIIVVNPDKTTVVLVSITESGSTKYIFRETGQLLYVEWHLYVGFNVKSTCSHTWIFKTSDNPNLVFKSINDKVIKILKKGLESFNVNPDEVKLKSSLCVTFDDCIKALILPLSIKEQNILKLTAILSTYDYLYSQIAIFEEVYNLSFKQVNAILKETYNISVIKHVGNIPKALK